MTRPHGSSGVPELPVADADIELMLDVLTDEATPEQEAEFDRRYVHDDAFHMVAAHVVAIWCAPVDWAQVAADARAEMRAGARGRRGRGGHDAGEPGTGRFVATLFGMGAGTLAVAILLTMFVGYGGIMAVNSWLFKPDTSMIVGTRPVHQPPGSVARPPAPLPKGTLPVMGRPSTNLITTLNAKGRALTTGSAFEDVLGFPDSTRIVVRAGSSMRYATDPNGITGAAIELVSGELSILVPPGSAVQVVSRAGVANLWVGAYAVRCAGPPDGCDELNVSVARGKAELRADRTNDVIVTLQGGAFGRAVRDQAAVTVSAGAARGFPIVDPGFARLP